MKIGTFIKLGALAVAAASTAAGSVFITTKALTKVTDKPKTDGDAPAEEAPASAFEPAPAAPVYEPAPAPVYEPAPAFAEEPIIAAAPIIEETPAPVVEEAPLPVIEEPVVEAPVVEEPAPEPEPEYTDVSMALPYLAGQINEENDDIADVVITPAEAAAAAVVAPVVEEAPAPVVEEAPLPVVEEPVVEAPVAEPITPVVEPVAPAVEEAPLPLVEELAVEAPVAEPITPVVEPAIPVIEEPVVSAPVETFANITPVSVEDSAAPVEEPVVLPPVEETAAPVTFGDISPVEEPVPVAPVVEEPVVAPAAPETPAAKGKTTKIGDAVVSDKADDAYIAAVSSAFNLSADNLVSIAADGNMPMVFEFLYADMRNDATLMSVYFIGPDGQAVLPPEVDRENVLAFGRNFITGNEELKAFLA